MEQQKMPPGFRFSPTDEELVVHYLRNRACGRDYHQGMIAEVDIYKHEPWDLPEKSALSSPDPVWYFFNAQDKRHSHSARINRTTSKGYWKATGKDRKICSGPLSVGIKKTLIYYEGRAPSGKRTDWIMHEYKLDEDFEKRSKAVCSAALCRIRKKGGPGPRNGEQYGASLFNENGEWGEDADDDVDEMVPLPSASSKPDQVEVSEEKVVLDRHKQVCALNDLPHAEGVDSNTDLDLYAFLETFLNDNVEVTSLEADMAPFMPAMDRAQMGQNNINCNTNHGVYAPSDVESLLGLDGTNVHDILHPTCNEEQILGELLHLTDGSQCHTNTPDCNERILSSVPLYSNGNPYPDGNLYDAGSSDVFGDYIEMNDMIYPLDGLVLRSPSYYGIEQQQQQLPSDLFDEMEGFGWSRESLNTQGSATRRLRLQIRPPLCATQMCKLPSEVPVSSGITIHIDSISNDNGQKLVDAASGIMSGSDSESDDINGWASPKSSKHVSSYTGAKSKEMHAATDSLDEESPAFKTTNFINMIRVHPIISDAVSFSPSLLNTSACIKEESFDCEAGLDTDGGSFAINSNTPSSHIQEAGLDCEAGPSSTVPGESFELAHTNKEVGQLVSKVTALTLGNRFVELESNLSTTFNDKVFALGKPVARLFPSKDYTNPYRSLRSGAMSSLCHLGLAVLVLFFLFLGIHMLTKYVLSLAA